MSSVNNLSTRGLLRCLSAAGFTGMPTTTLPLDYLYHIIVKNKIEFLIERHVNRHICKECL
ncbi:hypothetical protein ACFLUU_05220 [Chloroflexota bacterium]